MYQGGLTMTQEEKKEQTIQCLSDMLRTTTFSVEFKVKKKPQGIKVIIDVTREYINAIVKQACDKAHE